MAAAANNQSGGGNHLANLMHHEALAMHLQGEPFGATDHDGGVIDGEGFDDAVGGGVSEGLVDGVVVESVGAHKT